MTSGEETFALAREGDTEAYREVVLAHHAALYRWAAAELLDTAAAASIVEEAFVRGWERLRSFPREDAFAGWLYRTARSLMAERARSRREIPQSANSAWREEPFNVALALLPDTQRAALVMREWGGLPYEEIAVRLGASTSTVRSRLSLAREAIMRRL